MFWDQHFKVCVAEIKLFHWYIKYLDIQQQQKKQEKSRVEIQSTVLSAILKESMVKKIKQEGTC